MPCLTNFCPLFSPEIHVSQKWLWNHQLIKPQYYNANSDSLDLEDDDKLDIGETHVKEFVPLKKKKLSAKDHIGEAVSLLNTIVEKDPAKELIRFMQDETEKSKHELEMVNSDQHEKRASGTHSVPGGQNHLNLFNFKHHQIPPLFHTPPALTESFEHQLQCILQMM